MDFKQKEAAERRARIAATRQWMAATGKPDDGFADWYEDTGKDIDGVRYSDAHAAWLVSPARIERWAERNGIFIGKGFARWYLAEQRTDSFAEAYEVYRAMILAEAQQASGRADR